MVPVPGACAAVNALIASGQATRRFAFEAFLPMDKKRTAGGTCGAGAGDAYDGGL